MALPAGWQETEARERPQGGQGELFQVVRQSDPAGPLFALKRLKNVGNEARKTRFTREITTMRVLNEAGLPVPEVIESGEDIRGRPYLVTRWFTDGTLQGHIDARRFVGDPLGGIDLLKSLALAMQAIHDHGFAHRDLKPANILMDNGSVIVTDFGLVLPVDATTERVTDHAEAVGARHYIAPENEDGINEEVDQRPADFYAFAKILYVVLGSCSPLARSNQLLTERRLETVTGEQRLAGLAPLQIDLLKADPRARLADWNAVIRELGHVRLAFDPNAAADTPVSIYTQALRAARDFAASEEALAAEADSQRREQLRERFRWLSEAFYDGFNEDSEEIAAIDKAAGGHLHVGLSNGGVHLRDLLGQPAVSEAVSRLGATRDQLLNADYGGEHAVGLAHVSRDDGSVSIQIGGFIVIVGETVYLLLIPAVVRPPARAEVPASLFMRFGQAEGPHSLNSAITGSKANELGKATHQIGVLLFTEQATGTYDHFSVA